MKILLEDKDVKIIKKLNYISNINKNQKDMKSLFQEPMKNLKISLIENENNIEYKEYYFNGMNIPKDIEFSDIGITNFKVSWKIDEMKIPNMETKQIKYKIELRKKDNGDFKLVYENNNDNCTINNLDKDTNYEIRLCSIYNNLISNWTEVYKVKTRIIDSSILNNVEKTKEYINKIKEWTGCKSMNLLYRGIIDGMTANDFHNKCDDKGKTICLFLNDKDNIFGGYSSIPWTNNDGGKIANDCFLFTLSNIHNTEPTKFPFEKGKSVQHLAQYGPVFGSDTDLHFEGNFTFDKSNVTNFPYSYKDTLSKGKSIFTGDFDNKNINFKIKELEVFQLL